MLIPNITNTLEKLNFEYGLLCNRLSSWSDSKSMPFGGAYCVVDAGTESLKHVNEPSDEQELFICIKGTAKIVIGESVFEARMGDQFLIPCGVEHYVNNDTSEDFHYYAIWWNAGIVSEFNREKNQ